MTADRLIIEFKKKLQKLLDSQNKVTQKDTLAYLIQKQNHTNYQYKIQEVIREALQWLHQAITPIWSVNVSTRFLFSFHYSSLFLGQWLRVLGNEGFYDDSSLSAIEKDILNDLYFKEPRHGHLLLDPKDTTKKIQLKFGTGGDISPTAWQEARELLKDKVFVKLLRWQTLESQEKERIKNFCNCLPILLTKGRESEDAVRSFLVTFFYTIGSYQTDATGKYDGENHFVFAYPATERPDDRDGDEPRKFASLALVVRYRDAIKLIPKPTRILDNITRQFARTLRYFELKWFRQPSRLVIEEEDNIRKSCHIDWEMTSTGFSDAKLKNLNKFSTWMNEFTKKNKAIRNDSTFEEFTNKFSIVAASDRFFSFIEDIKHCVDSDHEGKEDEGGQVIFLSSEPGCGKENLARLIHLFSPRAGKVERLTSHFKKLNGIGLKDDLAAYKNLHEHGQSFCKSPFKKLIKENRNGFKLVNSAWKKERLFNYFTCSMANFHTLDIFCSELFGAYDLKNPKQNYAGRFLAAHFLGGTVFLDEFNTLKEPNWANSFLRLLDKPYEMDITGRKAGCFRDLNVFTIIASNRTRSQLIEDGFNPAVVYRLTKRYFEVPPVRERREDIAVFVNKKLRKYNENHLDKPIKRIEFNAMKLICELPWPDNYRGLDGLLSDILDSRNKQETNDLELKFEMVVRGLRKRELLRASQESQASRVAVLQIPMNR